MYMSSNRLLMLAYWSLSALILVGTSTMGEHSWMASLLVVPSLLILGAMGAWRGRWRPSRRGSLRFLRIGAAFGLASIPAAFLYRSLGSTEFAMWVVFVPTMLFASLVDREYFGWTDQSDRSPPVPTS